MREKQTTSTFSATTLRKTGRRFLLTAACTMLSIAAGAQTYPTFTAGGSTALQTDKTPSMTLLFLPPVQGQLLQWEPAMAYRDSTTGDVAVSLSKDGVTWSSPVDTGIATNEPVAMGNTRAGGLYILVYTGSGYQYITSTDGITFTPPQPVALSISGRTLHPQFEPSLTGYDTGLYLSVVDAKPGSPNAIDVLVSYDDGQSFSSIAWLSDIPTRSAAALTVYSVPNTRYEALALAYIGLDHHPVLRLYSDSTNSGGDPGSFSAFTATNVQMASTPALLAFTPPGSNNDLDLYIFGYSMDEAGHLLAVDWASPPNNQPPIFEPPQHYNRSFRHAPTLSSTRAGQLVIAFESTGDNRIQTYTAPPSPPPQ